MAEVRKGANATLIVEPDTVFTDPAATVSDRSGASLGTPTPTRDTVDTTVASATDATSMTLDTGDGVTPGRRYLVTSDEWSAVARVRAAVGTSVHLSDPLPGAPAAGATFKGLDISVPLSGAMTETLSEANLVVVQDGGSSAQAVAVYDVANHPYEPPVTAADVRAHVVRAAPGDPRLADTVWQAEIADDCNNRLRSRLKAAKRYLARYWDPLAFREPGLLMLRLVLAEEYGYFARASGDTSEHIRALRFELSDRIGDVIKSTEPYDADNDGKISDKEAAGAFSISVSRG